VVLILKNMKAYIFILISFFCIEVGYSQKNYSIIYECDTLPGGLVWFGSKNPPILKSKISDLEQELNTNIKFPEFPRDSIIRFIIKIIVNCDGSAKYSIFNLPNHLSSAQSFFSDVIDNLKSFCKWEPSKGELVFTRTEIKKVDRKLVKTLIYTQHLVRAGLDWIFILQNGEIRFSKN
jgi:hypothetical protein